MSHQSQTDQSYIKVYTQFRSDWSQDATALLLQMPSVFTKSYSQLIKKSLILPLC